MCISCHIINAACLCLRASSRTFLPTVWSTSAPISLITPRKFASKIRASPRVGSRLFPECRPRSSSGPVTAPLHFTPSGHCSTALTTPSAKIDQNAWEPAHRLSSDKCPPAKNRFGAIVRRKLPHDMLDVHFDRVFRKIKLGRDQLVRKTELKFREYVLFAPREMGQGLFGRISPDAVRLADRGQRGRAGERDGRRPIFVDGL